MLLLMLACTTDTFKPCGDGLGRADDGNCYPLADTKVDSADDTNSTQDSDSGTDTGGTDTGVGLPITVNGNLTITGDAQETAVCAVSAWNSSDLLTDGHPDHNKQPLSPAYSVVCPAGNGGVTAYSASFTIGSGTKNIVVFGFVDPDGTPETPTDTKELGSTYGAFDATPGLTYDGIDIVL